MSEHDDREPHEDNDNSHETSTALATVPDAPRPTVTAAQAKVEAVANLTMAAYQRASTLQLSADEIAKLQADFPDEAFRPGAGGKEALIYIEHAFLRDRLNQVLGIGQWSLVPRNRWNEEYRTKSGTPAVRVYVEAMLLVRGCFVSEAVGDMTYYPNNAEQNYGDAVEGAKTAALRRCAKEFGIGLQAWKKGWCEGWWQRRNNPAPKPEPKKTPKVDSKLKAITETTDILRLDKAREWALTLPPDKGKTYLDAVRERAGWLLLESCPIAESPEAANAVEDCMLDPKWQLLGTHWERDIRNALKLRRATFPKVTA